MIIKKVLKDVVIYCKTQGGQNFDEMEQMMAMRIDTRQVFFNLETGRIVNLKLWKKMI